ncbi:MAG: U32 family peptidase [Lentisphaerae bacterium]|nr:U32 family peptidase [Lentisphaerota bacterium]
MPPLTTVELLAPAGGLEAAYAALQHGADAIYLGLKQFSARAEAENFTLDEVAEVTAYAHEAFQPPRRVYVTLNTILFTAEVAPLARSLVRLEQIGVDALIVQDLGLGRLVREAFPGLRLHASTQMAIHSLAGARQLPRLGFSRVVLARELTLPEVAAVAALPHLQTEVFVHGALCYAYSGLCLLSSHLRGASGNRGACAYLCRNTFRATGDDAGKALMSMKDLALSEALPQLRQAGVHSLKIEGRKKSPLYVAAVTGLYRGLLDGTLSAAQRRDAEHDVKTIFSRPWTTFHLHQAGQPGVTDPDTVGHRGAPIGTVEAIQRGQPDQLVFTVGERALERYDGLQVDLPGREKPFGFSVEAIAVLSTRGAARSRQAFTAPPGARVAVPLPPGHPALPLGATLYCGSSQAVKRSYRWERPRPGTYGLRQPVAFTIRVDADALRGTAALAGPHDGQPTVSLALPLPDGAETARDPEALAAVARQAFAKLGGTPFTCQSLTFDNPSGRFLRMADLNDLRRRLVEALQQRFDEHLDGRADEAATRLLAAAPARGSEAARWELGIDRPEAIEAFPAAALEGLDEVTLWFDRLDDDDLARGLERLRGRLGEARLRLALPTVVRPWQEERLRRRLGRLLEAGQRRWMVANLAGFTYLEDGSDLDIAADWPLHTLNPFAAQALVALGCTSVTCSPEDSRDNLARLLPAVGDLARVVIYQDTPLAISAVCAFESAGQCPEPCQGRKHTCAATGLHLESRRGDRLVVFNDAGQSVMIGEKPLCWSHHLDDLRALGARRLRADFLWREYTPDRIAATWERLRRGEHLEGTHEGNW